MTSLSELRRVALLDPTIAPRLQAARVAYEAGFSKSSEAQILMTAPVFLPFAKQTIPVNVGQQFMHREIFAKGSTFSEALAEWHKELDKCPQSGEELIWRVAPETDCWCDFASYDLLWKVYARVIIIPMACGLSVGSEVVTEKPAPLVDEQAEPKPQLTDEEMWEHLRQIARGS